MYGIVLAAALTSGTTAADWGWKHKGCHCGCYCGCSCGCYCGGYGCYGCGCYGCTGRGGCYGCGGCFSRYGCWGCSGCSCWGCSCWGCYASHGHCFGCHCGGVIVAPPGGSGAPSRMDEADKKIEPKKIDLE